MEKKLRWGPTGLEPATGARNWGINRIGVGVICARLAKHGITSRVNLHKFIIVYGDTLSKLYYFSMHIK